jgi:hypothetical protein
MSRMLGRNIRITIGERRFHNSLRVAFSIEKTLGTAANLGRGQLDAWNLNPDSRAQLDRPGTQVIVEAGYRQDLSVLFAGDVLSDAATNLSRIKTVRDGPDWKTSIELVPRLRDATQIHMDLSVRAGMTLKDVLQLVTSKLNLQLHDSVQASIDAAPEHTFARGTAFAGRRIDILTDLCSLGQLEYWLDNGELHMLRAGAPSHESVVKLSANTGLLGSPERLLAGRLRFRSLLNTHLSPGRAVDIDSEHISGRFRVQRVTHNGNNFGTEFVSDAEANPT